MLRLSSSGEPTCWCLICRSERSVAPVCRARQAGTAGELPVKLRKQEPVAIEAALLLLRHRGRVLLQQRKASERRMAGFWELPSPEDLPAARHGERIGEFRHTITYHHYTFTVWAATGRAAVAKFQWFEPARLAEIPLSTTARKAMKLAGL